MYHRICTYTITNLASTLYYYYDHEIQHDTKFLLGSLFHHALPKSCIRNHIVKSLLI
jgi:hypothetical protein